MLLTQLDNLPESFLSNQSIHWREYSFMSLSIIKKTRKFPLGWEKFFDSNWEPVRDILLTLHSSQYSFAPKNDEIFRMLYEMEPKDIRLVIVGQSPYADGNACGIPFVAKSGKVTKTLQNISRELIRQYPYARSTKKNPNDVVLSWVDQGVFMINMSLSIGIPPRGMRKCDEYVLSHDILWEEFVRHLVRYIAKKKKSKIPIILFGSVAWGLEDEVIASYNIIKEIFPTRDEFIGSGVFGKCDQLVDGIEWI
jgi:uracil DNA glycosylase